VIYQDPLAYLLGLEGIALLDAWAGDHDRAFTDARLAEIRRLLDDDKLRGRGVLAKRVSTVTAYRQSTGFEPVTPRLQDHRRPSQPWGPRGGRHFDPRPQRRCCCTSLAADQGRSAARSR
jgi:hypothetical protein